MTPHISLKWALVCFHQPYASPITSRDDHAYWQETNRILWQVDWDNLFWADVVCDCPLSLLPVGETITAFQMAGNTYIENTCDLGTVHEHITTSPERYSASLILSPPLTAHGDISCTLQRISCLVPPLTAHRKDKLIVIFETIFKSTLLVYISCKFNRNRECIYLHTYDHWKA